MNKLPISAVIFFVVSFAAINSFLCFFNKVDIDSIEFLPTKISLNFSIIFFLIILLTPKPILDSESTISGANFISLIIDLRSFSFISFKFSFALLNIFVIRFNFIFPTKISFKEMFFSLLIVSIKEDNPLPTFCLFMLFTIAFATFSDALSESFATAGIVFHCFPIDLARLSIAFLIPFVSSRIS